MAVLDYVLDRNDWLSQQAQHKGRPFRSGLFSLLFWLRFAHSFSVLISLGIDRHHVTDIDELRDLDQ